MMNLAPKIVGPLMIVLGEILAIYAQVTAASLLSSPSAGDVDLWRKIVCGAFGGVLLVLGYVVSYRGFGSIWTVSAISVCMVLVVEPLMAWGVFREVPWGGSVAGLVLGTAGMIASMVWDGG